MKLAVGVSFMAIVWVHIKPVVNAEGGAAKSAFTDSAKEQIETKLRAQIEKELPEKVFSTKDAAKPTGKPSAHTGPGAYNAIKITAELTLGIEQAGSKMTVASSIRIEFDAIKYPNLKPSDLLVSGRSSTTLDGRKSGETGVVSLASEALDYIGGPTVKKLVAQPRLKSYGKTLGLPFD